MGDVPTTLDEQIRTSYVEDHELKASVIPSGKPAHMGGGSYAFDANNPNFPQNIIVCENGAMTKIAQVTRAQVAGATSLSAISNPFNIQPPSEADAVESILANFYKDLDASKKPEGPSVEPAQYIPKERVQVPVRETAPVVYVTIKGAFGKIRQPFSKVFRDGMCLILKVDHNTLPASYELPDLEDNVPMQLELKIGDHVVQCIWAGLQFTEDEPSATFTVLLIQEETDIEEGRLS